MLDSESEQQTLQNLASSQDRLRGNQALQAIASAAGIALGGNSSQDQEDDNFASVSASQERANVGRLNTSIGGSDNGEENVSNLTTDGGSTL
jgi:hypothetical protein